jgi:malonyl-CoA O-methyltransferase
LTKWDKKRKAMQRYDLTAEMYDLRYAEEQEAKYEKALETLNIPSNSLILDVGCGTGLLFSHVAADAQTVVGLDVSRKLLLQAKERERRFRNVHVVQADADHMPLKNDYFNVVFAFTVLQNMPNPSETLKEIKQTAKHDAPIVVTGLKKAFSPEAFRELLRHAGLRIVTFEDDDVLKCYVAVAVQS